VPLTAFVKLLADANPSLARLSNLLAAVNRSDCFFRRKSRVPKTAAGPFPRILCDCQSVFPAHDGPAGIRVQSEKLANKSE